MTGLPKLFWWEIGLGAANGVLCVVTVVWRDWLELVFKVDPDHHSGSFEWLIVGITFTLALALATLAWRERRTLRQA